MNLDRAGTGGVDVTGAAGEVARYAIEAAVWAPSIHDTQPWWFDTCSSGSYADMVVRLHADAERRSRAADPEGRETLISCGAALCTLRLAVLRCGRDPQVRVLPDPGRPGLLAEVRLGGPALVTAEVRELYGQIRCRRSHRGPFLGGRPGASVLSRLLAEARREGAALQLASEGVRLVLAALTKADEQADEQAGEQGRRLDPGSVGEPARRAGPASRRGMAVRPAGVEVRTEPSFPGRDLPWADGGNPAGGMGVVAVLTTDGDQRRDWLTAGQALQRVLLRAGAAGMAAAFHTEALQVPELRQFIGCRLFDGAHPQIVVRLGAARTGLGP